MRKEGGVGWGVSHQSGPGEKKARCWLWECAVHGSRGRRACGGRDGRGGGSVVVISQALRRERGPSRARGDSPSERIPFALLQEPPASGHKEGEKGDYGILYRAGQRRRIFSKGTGEREKLQCSREGGEEEEKKGEKKESSDRSGEPHASVWVAKRNRRIWSYCDPVSPRRHQTFSSAPPPQPPPHTNTQTHSELSYTTVFPVCD